MIQVIREELGLLIAIGLGIFLFVLFFQPFPFEYRDFNNSILMIAGLGAIVFLAMLMARIVFTLISGKDMDQDRHHLLPSYIHGFSIMTICSVAFIFYLRYVAHLEITFYIAVKTVIICLIPPLIERFYYLHKWLRMLKDQLTDEETSLQKQIEAFQQGTKTKKIEFLTEHGRENLMLMPSDIACIRSADNYVEIVYKEEEQFRKKLTRNTLRNIEQMLKPWSVFVRCHRTCLINLMLVESIFKKHNNHHIRLKGYNEEIPVARQYVYRLKDAIDKDQGRIPFARSG